MIGVELLRFGSCHFDFGFAVQWFTDSREENHFRGIEQWGLILLDAAEALSKYMEAEGPNRERFLSAFEPLIRDAEMGHHGLVVLGEGVGILCDQGRVTAAIEVERLWNELAQTHTFHVHCAYRMTEELKGTHTQ